MYKQRFPGAARVGRRVGRRRGRRDGRTSVGPVSDSPAPRQERNLLLDELDERLERFKALRKVDSAAADAVLDELGASSEVDRQIVLELSSRRALGHPQQFPNAHSLFMQSLEVLDRNGAKGVKLHGLGPLAAVAGALVQLVTRFIVRSYQSDIVNAVRRLYIRREARCGPDDPDRAPLRRARLDVERAANVYKAKALGLPSFLVGGAATTGLVSALRGAGDVAGRTRLYTIVAAVVLCVLFLVVAWAILRGAAVARRRIRMTVEKPLAALWETVGRCGAPPKDQARVFALAAIGVTALAGLVIPIGVLVAFARG